MPAKIMKTPLVLSVVFFGIFCAAASASDDIKFGVASYVALYEVSDPDGPSDSYSGLQPFNVAFAMPVSNSTRFFIEAGLVDFDIDGSSSNIASDVSGYRVASALQWKFRAARSFHFWFGLGASFSQLDFENRYTVDSDGYLDKRFDDRSESSVGGFANICSEWEFTDSFDIGLNVAYRYPFGDSVSGLTAGVAFYYKLSSR